MSNKISEALNNITWIFEQRRVSPLERTAFEDARKAVPLADECVSVLKECVTELDHRGGGKTMKRARALLEKLDAGQ